VMALGDSRRMVRLREKHTKCMSFRSGSAPFF
jgi:hypothetical protein